MLYTTYFNGVEHTTGSMNRLATIWCLLTVTTSTVLAKVLILRHAEPDHYPRYEFKYSVHDPKTKDHKEHWETRNGDLVKGAYSLLDPDGKLRLVDYWADDASGFNADVKRLGPGYHGSAVQPAPVVEQFEDASPKPETVSALPQEPVVVSPASAALDEGLKRLVFPAKYGFGLGGDSAPLGRAYTSALGTGSHRWDPKTGSYGGWVPLKPREVKYASLFTKKYIDGKLHEWAIGPVSLVGRTLVFKVKHH